MDALTFKLAKAIVLRHGRDRGADTPIELLRCKHQGENNWQGVIITPSAKRPSQWQLSYFDAFGFYGDSQHPSQVDAVEQAVQEGFVTLGHGCLEQVMGRNSWLSGADAHDPERARNAHTGV